MTEALDLFLGLTPDRVLAAVERSGLRCNTVCYPLNSFENRVYEVELEGRSRVVAKFYRPGRWSAEQILEEHAFLAELETEEVPVCAVRHFPDGSTLQRIDDIYYSLSDRRGGRAPDELSDPLCRRLGTLVARMHNVAARHAAVHRPGLDSERYIRRALRWLDEHQSLPDSLRRRYFDAAEGIADVADLLAVGVDTHRIHADLHLGNVLLRDDRLTLLDFDDMLTGPAVQDVWLALPGRDSESRRKRELFFGGYRELRDFDASSARLIEPLRGLRMVRYAGWLARRWHDPAFRLGWPHFGDDDYWRREVEDLEEQLNVVKGQARLPATIHDPERRVEVDSEIELTNKDYFWDWEGH